jgi:large subunit ribosomal protein L2
MELIFSKPTTPSQRHLVRLNKKHLTKISIIKQKIIGTKTTSGRNHSGKIMNRHKGGGHKKRYRKIEFSRTTTSLGIVTSIEYDPNRNANIASIHNFTKNNFFYILAPKKLNVGNIVESGPEAPLHTGNSLPLFNIPEGSFIHAISLTPTQSAKITRAAGCSATIKEKTLTNAKIKISSKKEKVVDVESYATLGILSNESHFLTRLGKAGQARWLNKRPRVRGVAMNPVDHPHGGGEGKKSGKRFTPWGKQKNKK